MTFSIKLTARAEQHIEKLGVWWRANRTMAPYLFRDEMDKAIRVLRETPQIGQLYLPKKKHGVRRYLLKRTPYHLYYRMSEVGEVIEVIAVWSSMRKHGPPLGRL